MKKAIIIGIMVACIGLSYLFPHEMLNPGELVEAHQDLNNKCLSCHTAFSGIPDNKCISCHKVSEIGKNDLQDQNAASYEMKTLFHQHLSKQECTSCHTDHKGIQYVVTNDFKHEMLAKSVLNNCANCHKKPVDSIHKPLSANCRGCHTTEDWKLDVTFNHDLIQGPDKLNCTSCHQKPDDTYHKLLITGCNKCHNTTKWVPSTFDHTDYFLLDRDHNVTCTTCHTNKDFVIYTCYGCHEHSENKMIEEHNKEGIYNITNCASCHKSADEHDIRNGIESDQKDINRVREYIRKKDKENANEND